MSSLLTLCLSVALFIAVLGVDNCSAHETIIGTCTSTSHGSHAHRYDSNCKHHHEDHHHHTPNLNFHRRSKLPEELAEEEDLMSHDFEFQHHDISYDVSAMGLWIGAMGCSLLVSMASLICLILLPVILFKGKPSKTVVDCLAIFGAGAMLGDAFLHQLPHAFGGKHMHVHEHHVYHAHSHFDYNEHDHAHSLSELSIGLSILSGIVLFLIVEKIVRHVENLSRNGGYVWGYGHHHHKHHHTHVRRSDKDGCQDENIDSKSVDAWNNLDSIQNNCMDEQKVANNETIRKRVTSGSVKDDKNQDAVSSSAAMKMQDEKGTVLSSNIVFGYLNLFSDGVHNFTDGMALGSAFLLHGSVGGWSRTLFLLAHEIPQEIGDFGILLRSGFSVSKALFFNFLSALVALGGTALALILGKDPGHSSLIEGFTAGGFIYIAVAGVLPEMNNGSSSSIKSTIIQVASLILGMAVALGISLVE